MDILTHTLSGMAVATVAAAFGKKRNPFYCLLAGAIGGALPDIDAISLWTKFDATIGQWLHLSHKGADIYFGKLWYSHHGFFHSLAAALLGSMPLFLLAAAVRRWRMKKPFALRAYLPPIVSFFAAYTLHLLEDMLTPAGTWGGVNLWWPLKTYTGGSGKIWWWNNYDLFLIALSVLVANGMALLCLRRHKRKIVAGVCTVVLIAGLSLGIRQINSRQINYAYKGYTKKFGQLEQQSLKEQERLLGKRTFKAMQWLDRRVAVNF